MSTFFNNYMYEVSMYNDDNTLKSILKESYGSSKMKCDKKKPFSKLIKKLKESGEEYADGGWGSKGSLFSGEGGKKTVRRTTGQAEPKETMSEWQQRKAETDPNYAAYLKAVEEKKKKQGF